MATEPDDERIRRKAHELWEADGRRHGRDHDHWVQAREIIAIEDSQADTLLPRDTGAQEPIEDADEALRNLADFPNLTDQGENLLTSTDREPYGSGDMPSVEVPTSDQPGIPTKTRAAASKPALDMKASEKGPPEKTAPKAKAAPPPPEKAGPKGAAPKAPPPKPPPAGKPGPGRKKP